LDVHVEKSVNRIVKVTGTPDKIPNDGLLCVKGRFGYDFVHSSRRLKNPLVRKNGVLEPVSWETALDLAAKRLFKIRERFGPDSISGMASARDTNENNYAIMKFMRAVIGTNNIDHCART
jgi:predicted molibdopterin-dependent oxidoreductase YjgC